MAIIVIDKNPEIFWFTQNALASSEDYKLIHIEETENADETIIRELPELVIVNADDTELNAAQIIKKMRNRVFARSIPFLAITSTIEPKDKEDLVKAGVSQIVYRKSHENPDPKYFKALIDWILTSDNPEKDLFDYGPMPFTNKSDFTTFGRIGYLNNEEVLVETYLELPLGSKIELNAPVFDEIGVSVQGEVKKINHTGRYYKYSTTMLLKLEFVNAKKRDQTQKVNELKDLLKNNLEKEKFISNQVSEFKTNLDKETASLDSEEDDTKKEELKKNISSLNNDHNKLEKEKENIIKKRNELEGEIKKLESMLSQDTKFSPEKQQALVLNWINTNQNVTKPKLVKIVFFEPDTTYRSKINNEINSHSKYCMRGYHNLINLESHLSIEMPHLILVNRDLIEEDGFDGFKKYLAKCSYPCFMITYSLIETETESLNELKDQHSYAIHAPSKVSESLLSVLIKKLENTISKNAPSKESVYFSKNSVNSRISLKTNVQLVDLGKVGVGIQMNANFHNTGGCLLESRALRKAGLPHHTFCKTMFIKKNDSGQSYHRLLFVGLNNKEFEKINFTLEQLSEMGLDNWNMGLSDDD